RPVTALTHSARLSGAGTGIEALRDGHDRPQANVRHGWQGPLGAAIEMTWPEPVTVGGLRIVFDSDLNQHKRMPCSFPLKGNQGGVPASMIRKYRIEACQADGSWSVIYRAADSYQRLARIPLNVRTQALRVIPEETWGVTEARIVSIDALAEMPAPIGEVPAGQPWLQRVACIPPQDLAEPQSGLEATGGRQRSGA
ncbi:MAG: hypothetical protein WCI73_14595, partial [Phycisphaerae bacterium]